MIYRPFSHQSPPDARPSLWVFAVFTALLFICSGAFRPVLVHAQSLEVKDLVLERESGQVQVRFGLEVKGVDELRQILEEGGVFELQCRATLFKKRGVVWDSVMGRSEFLSQINANPLSQSFSVVDAASSKIVQNKNLSELLQDVWKTIALDLGSMGKLEKGHVYRVVLTVGIEQVDVPQWVKRSMFFWSFEAIPKTSVELTFTN